MTPEVLQLVRTYDRLSSTLEAEAIARLDATLERSYKNLERELLRGYSKLQGVEGLLARQRSLVLFNDLGETLSLVSNRSGGEYADILRSTLQATDGLGDRMSRELIRSLSGNSIVRTFAGIPLEAIALQARDGVRRLSGHSETFRNKASAVVEQGLVQGWGTKRIERSLRAELGIVKSKAEAIARTEVMSSLNSAAQLRYQAIGIDKVQWMVTPSDALCRICASRNMRVYAAGKVIIPSHVNCRCIAVPFSEDWQQLGATDDAFAKEYRDRILADLKDEGRSVDYRLSPFENAAGLTKAPEYSWSP